MTYQDPVFEKDGKFFFHDETWTDSYGPFDTREEAQSELIKYCVWLETGERI